MEKLHPSVTDMWQAYTSTPEGVKYAEAKYDAWHFCADEKNANELGDLVNKGIKTATCSLDYWYDVDEEEVRPEVGDHSVITDWDGKAICIIKTTKAYIKPLKDVDADHAYKEGEGDRSYEHWYRVHMDYFDNELKEINKTFTEDMDILCEEFEKVFPK